jgi:hypothetical protein
MIDFQIGKAKPQWGPSDSGTESHAEDPKVKDLDVAEPEAEDVKAGFGAAGWDPKRPFMG